MGKNLMKVKIISLVIFAMFCNVFSFGQYNVLLVNGKSLNTSSIKVKKELIVLTADGEEQSIAKEDILCVIPELGRSYSYRKKNNKKIKILKRDIVNKYEGTDIVKLFAYKYYGSTIDIGQLYLLNSDKSPSEEEFKNVFDKQQQKIRSRTIISTTVSVIVLIIVVPMFIRTLNDVNSLSNNNLDLKDSNKPHLELNDTYFEAEQYLHKKLCA